MKYAVIKTGGKQYKVSEGDVITVENLNTKTEEDINFMDVLLLASDSSLEIGAPFLSGIVVKGTILENLKGPKIKVVKYKAKARYRRVMGHRQTLSRVKINSIAKEQDKKPAVKKQPKTVNTEKAQKA